MKERRGRKTVLTTALTKRICALLAKGSSIKSACIQSGVSEKSYHNWIERGRASEAPYEEFFLTASRAREQWKQGLIETVMAAAHKDARHAEWLLEKSFPAEYGDRRPLPIPQAEPASVDIKMFATLPSGNIASVDEMLAISRQWHEKWNQAPAVEQHANEPMENEPMLYNPATRRVEPIDNGDVD